MTTPAMAQAGRWRAVVALLGILVLSGCSTLSAFASGGVRGTQEFGVTVPTRHSDSTAVGFVTDYGQCDKAERQVASMVTQWETDAVVTSGDNSQGVAGCTPFTESVGEYFGDFIHGPDGPRLFPSTGNHDYEDAGAGLDAYANYFSYLPHNSDDKGRWYSVRVGQVAFFILDSEAPAKDLDTQRVWLQRSLAAAPKDVWKVVIFHRPPFTSGPHPPLTQMSPSAGWTYREWGADLVLSGHQHYFEDVVVDGMHYVTTGVGGKLLERPCPATRTAGSQTCVDGPGAALIRADSTRLSLEYRTLVPGSTPALVELSR